MRETKKDKTETRQILSESLENQLHKLAICAQSFCNNGTLNGVWCIVARVFTMLLILHPPLQLSECVNSHGRRNLRINRDWYAMSYRKFKILSQ